MKIFLSSMETGCNKDVLIQIKEPKNLLASFYYLRRMPEQKMLKMLFSFIQQGCSIMLDSGAHTFLNEMESKKKGRKGVAQKKMTKTLETPDQYFEEFLKFVDKYKQYFNYIVELDIDGVVGYNKVVGWQKRLILLGIKNKLILVYHPTIPNSFLEFERWCKEGFIVGIGGFPSIAIHNKLFDIALKYKTKVHGFAMTKTWFMIKYPWFSVDSSSWNLGQRFGLLLYFDRTSLSVKTFSLRQIKTDANKLSQFRRVVFPEVSRYMKVSFLDFLNKRSSSPLIDLCNANAFLQQEKVLTKLWEKRGIIYT